MLQGVGRHIKAQEKQRRGGIEISTYIHEVLLHVVGKVLEHGHLAHKVLRNLASGEDGALAQLCIVVDGPEEAEGGNQSEQGILNKQQESQVDFFHMCMSVSKKNYNVL